ncbi:MAG: hypothetical protein U0946_01835 [Patescibacteria group bacterium]|nr:hypothetical protein [Patescibacteria group bacterium]
MDPVPPTSIPPLVMPPSPSTPSAIWIYIALITLFLWITGTLAYQYFQLKNQVTNLTNTVTSTPVSTVSPKPSSEPANSTVDWKTYTINQLNLSFKLPPELAHYGALVYATSPSSIGSELCWTFGKSQSMIFPQVHAGGGPCETNNFSIGATTLDHDAGRMSGFADTNHFQLPENLPPSMTKSFTNPNGVKILRIIGGEFPKEPNDPWEGPSNYFGELGKGHIGALVQYLAPNYETITVHMELTDSLTVNVFDLILSTFKFTTP